MMRAIIIAQSLCTFSNVPRSLLPLNDRKAKLLELLYELNEGPWKAQGTLFPLS